MAKEKSSTTKTKNKKYITLSNGVDFRRISEMMSDAGYRMNHATARNCLLKAMRSFLMKTTVKVGVRPTDELLDSLMHNNSVHDAMCDVLYSVHELDQENE